MILCKMGHLMKALILHCNTQSDRLHTAQHWLHVGHVRSPVQSLYNRPTIGEASE